MMMPGLANPKP